MDSASPYIIRGGLAGRERLRLLAPVMLTLENIADAVLAEDLASRGELGTLIHDLYSMAEDRHTIMSLPRVVQAWSKRNGTPIR